MEDLLLEQLCAAEDGAIGLLPRPQASLLKTSPCTTSLRARAASPPTRRMLRVCHRYSLHQMRRHGADRRARCRPAHPQPLRDHEAS